MIRDARRIWKTSDPSYARMAPRWTSQKSANIFVSSAGNPYSMTYSAKSTEQPFAADGGIGRVRKREQDPFRALDDLMVVVEALCPAWPQRKPFESTDEMRL